MTKRRKRKLRTGRLVLLVVILASIITLSVLGIKMFSNKEDDYVFDPDSLHINELDYSDMKLLDLDLYSKSYMLVRLSDLKVLYGKDINTRFYPASLTKVVTLDTVVHNVKDMDKTSHFSQADYDELINANASIADLKVNTDYTIEDLLYALVLPSGADAGRALENYFRSHSKDLVSEMNILMSDLSLRDSHFTNTAGLHDEQLYTTLDDYCRVVIDALLNDTSKRVLKSFEHELEDGTYVSSTLKTLQDNETVTVFGGKTGFTGEAGENIMVLYSWRGRSYLLILAGADGNPYQGQSYHFRDVNNIIDYLYN